MPFPYATGPSHQRQSCGRCVYPVAVRGTGRAAGQCPRRHLDAASVADELDPGRNAGFSAAPAGRLYLPVDPDPDRPTVAGQRADENSLLHLVKDLVAARRAHPELGPGGSLEILHDGYPLAYLRGGCFLVIVNPCGRARVLRHDRPELATATEVRHTGVVVEQAMITAGPFSFGIFRL